MSAAPAARRVSQFRHPVAWVHGFWNSRKTIIV
jgi:hypothetical protein